MFSHVSSPCVTTGLAKPACIAHPSFKLERDLYTLLSQVQREYILVKASLTMPLRLLDHILSPLPLMIPRPLSRRLYHRSRILNWHRLPRPNTHFLHCLSKQPTLRPTPWTLQIAQRLTRIAHALLHLHQLPLMLLFPLISKQLPCPVNRPMPHMPITRHP